METTLWHIAMPGAGAIHSICYGSGTDINRCGFYVRFTPQSRHSRTSVCIGELDQPTKSYLLANHILKIYFLVFVSEPPVIESPMQVFFGNQNRTRLYALQNVTLIKFNMSLTIIIMNQQR